MGGSMINAGIKEVKNNLSAYLARVKQGEQVTITERGKPIARLVAEKSASGSLRQALEPLIARGVVTFPNQPINRLVAKPVKAEGRPVAQIVSESRR